MNKRTKIILIMLIIVIASVLITLVVISYPKQKDCKDYSYDNCPSSCVVCPPCEYCSSLSCQTKEYCEKIGFNRSWYEGIKKGSIPLKSR